jgi:hypothetical protein
MTVRLLPLALLAGACAIAPPPPAPDPIAAPVLREEGQLALSDPAQTAFCVSQEMPASLVELIQDGATVRPATVPTYALVLTGPEQGRVAWRLLVADRASDPEATALRLRRALADCLGRLGRST